MSSIFAPAEPLSQAVSRLDFMQMEFPLFQRLDGPSVAPQQWVGMCKTYRQAVRVCWQLRRQKRMTRAQLAIEAGLYPQHVTDYLHEDDAPTRRDLPGDKLAAFEEICGNTLVTQWHASRASLTVMEEAIATRKAA